MVCKRCKQSYDEENWNCPHCGEGNPVVTSGVLKTSTILIAAGEKRSIYRSVKEVPAGLRRRLLKSTNGLNSATILIADRRGREEIAKAVRSLPGSIQRRILPSILSGGPAASTSPPVRRLLFRAVALVLLLLTIVFVWAVFGYKPQI